MSSSSKKESPKPGVGLMNERDIQKPKPVLISNHNGIRRETDWSEIPDDREAVFDIEIELENGKGTESKRKISNAIPRSKRRGLFAQLVVGIPEIDDPVQYSPRTKNLIVFIIAVAAIAAPMGSAIYLPALPYVIAGLDTNENLVNLTVALYMLALGLFPLWWSAASERVGRRTVYVISFGLWIVFNVLCATSQHIIELIIMRILAAGAGASVQAVGVGTLADIYIPKQRGRAMGWFYIGPLTGPLIAPIIGGPLNERFGWRSTLWFLALGGAVQFLLLLFFLPETMRPPQKILVREACNGAARERKIWKVLKVYIIDPFKLLLLLRYPPVLLTVTYASVAFGTLYCMNISITYSFSIAPYNYTSTVVGLLYLGNSLGYIVGSTLGGRWSDYIFVRSAKKHGGELEAEGRFGINTWVGAIMYPLGMLMYGWTVEKGLFVIIPEIGTFFLGLGMMIVFTTVTTYLIDAVPGRSSSAVAMNTLIRNVFACAGAIIGKPLIEALGNGILFSILAGISFASSACIWAIIKARHCTSMLTSSGGISGDILMISLSIDSWKV